MNRWMKSFCLPKSTLPSAFTNGKAYYEGTTAVRHAKKWPSLTLWSWMPQGGASSYTQSIITIDGD